MQSPVIILGARSLVGPYLLERLVARNFSGEAAGRDPEAPDGLLPGGFRWRRLRDLPGRRLRGAGNVAVLRLPERKPARRDWSEFVPFA